MFNGNTIQGRFCQAIAFAEGCIHKDSSYNTFSLPYRLNNPGDLKVTSSTYTYHMSSSGKLQFQDIGTGWNALAHQVDLMFTNKSFVYRSKMSIQEVADHYAKEHDTPAEKTNAANWAKNVAAYLDVPVETTLDQLLQKELTMTNTNLKQTNPFKQAVKTQ